MRWQMQVTLKEPLIFEGLERAHFWSSHGTLQREIAPFCPCLSQSLRCVLLVFFGLPSSDERIENIQIQKKCVETNLVSWWLACQGFSRNLKNMF